jgi:hypothetical protein
MVLEELKSAVAQNSRILQMLQASSVVTTDVPELPSDIRLPLTTMHDLQLLEDQLEDDELLTKTLVRMYALYLLYNAKLCYLSINMQQVFFILYPDVMHMAVISCSKLVEPRVGRAQLY